MVIGSALVNTCARKGGLDGAAMCLEQCAKACSELNMATYCAQFSANLRKDHLKAH